MSTAVLAKNLYRPADRIAYWEALRELAALSIAAQQRVMDFAVAKGWL